MRTAGTSTVRITPRAAVAERRPEADTMAMLQQMQDTNRALLAKMTGLQSTTMHALPGKVCPA